MEARHFGEYVSQRQDTEKLSGHRYDEAVDSVAQRLENGAENDAVACKQEAGRFQSLRQWAQARLWA